MAEVWRKQLEVYFVDVGLGSCQIILLGNRRAIVIDCGVKSDHIALQFLKRLGIIEIVCLITSHSDSDHTGGAISILDDYQDGIGNIFIVQDNKFLGTKYWQRIDFLLRQGILKENQIKQLLIEEAPKELWNDGQGSRLRIFSPSFVENLRAQQYENTNASSSVIVLDHTGFRFVFASDSMIPQWRRIHDRRQNRKLECDVLAVPHHGGRIDDEVTDLDWLYEEALSAKYAVLSVGTRLKPKHPRKEVVDKLISCGATVLCTEITTKCHPKPSSLAPGVVRPQILMGRAFDDTQRGKNRFVACAGTVLAAVDEDGLKISRLSEHQVAVDKLEANCSVVPLCRRPWTGAIA